MKKKSTVKIVFDDVTSIKDKGPICTCQKIPTPVDDNFQKNRFNRPYIKEDIQLGKKLWQWCRLSENRVKPASVPFSREA